MGLLNVDPDRVEKQGRLFLVADGMGGHPAGNVARRMAVEGVARAFYANATNDSDLAEHLRHSIQTTNLEIYHDGATDPEHRRMGSTVVALAIHGRHAYIANVGDSRVYLVRNRTVRHLTRDHNWTSMQVALGSMTTEEAATSPGKNILLRCLGEKPEVLVDVETVELQIEDVFLLCTDGLHGLVTEDEIKQQVEKSNITAACQSLVDLANNRGGPDNISVQIVRVRSLGH